MKQDSGDRRYAGAEPSYNDTRDSGAVAPLQPRVTIAPRPRGAAYLIETVRLLGGR
jgi:hypothetical protein